MLDWIDIAETAGDGLITRDVLVRLGVARTEVERALVLGVLYRVRRGVVARPPLDPRTAAADRHRLLVRATVAAIGGGRIVSHQSAVAMHRLPTIGTWPARVEVLAVDASRGMSTPGLRAYATAVHPETELIDGVLVTSLARTLADLASSVPLLPATTALDAALHRKLIEREQISTALEELAPRYGARRAESAIAFADGRAETPGESLSRVRIHQVGLEAPELQIPVGTPRGDFVVDFGWRSVPLFGEFDGIEKYIRADMLAGETPAQAVIREKRREDAIRQQSGRPFARWGWSDALSAKTLERILRDAGVPRAR